MVASCRDEIDAGREEVEEVVEEDMATCLEGSMRSDYEVDVYAAGTLDDQSRGRCGCSVVTRRLEGTGSALSEMRLFRLCVFLLFRGTRIHGDRSTFLV